MTIRITITPVESGTRVKIDGDLDTEVLSEVDAACASATGSVVFDLADMKTLDSAGEVCLRRLIDAGATVEAAQPYIRMRLGLNTQ